MELQTPENRQALPLDLYHAGYRAKRTSERCGAVKEPDGSIHRLNVYSATCTCTPGVRQTPGAFCIHVRMYTALRFIQLGKRIGHNNQEDSRQVGGTIQ